MYVVFRMHNISGDAGTDADVRDSRRLVLESVAILLRPRGGRRAEAQEAVGREVSIPD